jgi:hypothetical protein
MFVYVASRSHRSPKTGELVMDLSSENSVIRGIFMDVLLTAKEFQGGELQL